VMPPKDGFDLARRTIATADPDEFGRRAQNFAYYAEVRISGDQSEPLFESIIPMGSLGGLI
jgi:hypothetical protein